MLLLWKESKKIFIHLVFLNFGVKYLDFVQNAILLYYRVKIDLFFNLSPNLGLQENTKT